MYNELVNKITEKFPEVVGILININEESTFTPFATLRLLSDILLPNLHDCLYLDG